MPTQPAHRIELCLPSITDLSMLILWLVGKEEGGGFTFSQTMLDDIINVMKDILSGAQAAYNGLLKHRWFRPVVHL